MRKINLAQAFAAIPDCWNPRLAGTVNDCAVKLAKLSGAFVWHAHEHEDEMFLLVSGRLTLKFRDRDVELVPGEFVIVPRGVEHMPVAPEGEAPAEVLLFEPAATVNTGDVVCDRTRSTTPPL